MKIRILPIGLILLFAPDFALGASTPHYLPALGNTLTVVSSIPANLTGYNLANEGPAMVYVQLFDASSTGGITLGTTTPTMTLAIPANGVTDAQPTFGVAFLNGIVVAATTTPTGNTAPIPAINANFYTQ